MIENKAARNMALDVLRGIAVIMVMCHHIIEPKIAVAAVNLTDKAFDILKNIILFIKAGGWIGVDLFFVLSGFLVSGLIFREYQKTKTIDPWRFLIRRGFKIYPIFFVFLLLTILFEYISYRLHLPCAMDIHQYHFSLYLKDGIFAHNYLYGRWGHTWSLDVEEHFYILLVIYFLYLIKTQKLNYTRITYSYIALALFGIIARITANINHPQYTFQLHYSQTHFRLDALFFGVYLSYLYQYYPEKLLFFKKYKVYLLIFSTLYLLTNYVYTRNENVWISVISLAIHPLCFGSILMIALDSKNKLFKNRFLSSIGKLSYAIYIWHVFVTTYMISYFPQIITVINYWLLYVLSFFVISFGFGIFFTKYVEVPFLNLRNKYYPAKTPAPIILSS